MQNLDALAKKWGRYCSFKILFCDLRDFDLDLLQVMPPCGSSQHTRYEATAFNSSQDIAKVTKTNRHPNGPFASHAALW